MRVGINARLLREPNLRGWNRYAVNLLARLPAQGVDLVLYSDHPVHPDHLARLPAGSFVERVGRVRPHFVWEQSWLPRQCAVDGVNLLHAPANFGLPWSCPCPRVLTLHDAIEPIYYWPRAPLRTRWGPTVVRSRLGHWASRSCAERVITVSRHARGDLINALGLDASRIRVTYEAADPGFQTPPASALASALAAHGIDRRYVFYVGGWEGRKNVPFLVRAFADAALADVDLVLAGGKDDQRATLQSLADGLGVGDRLKLLGWVADADLPALYAGALAFAYPSEYEGFGLQVCEAMAVGCPVLAARASCLPEILGNGGETFALDTVRELSYLLQTTAHDPAFRDDLIARARARSADFSWDRAAAETAAVYRELVPGG